MGKKLAKELLLVAEIAHHYTKLQSKFVAEFEVFHSINQVCFDATSLGNSSVVSICCGVISSWIYIHLQCLTKVDLRCASDM
jgi:hypothetical protein